MHTVNTEVVIERVDDRLFDETKVAAVAFLARYNGRTLDAYRADLRGFFDWAGIVGLEVLTATRGHVELYRQHMEQRGLAASTIDRRLSTVCGFYRFAHIDGRITANPAQYVRRPKVHPSEGRGLDRNKLGRFLFTAERVDRAHAALAVLLGFERAEGQRSMRYQHRGPGFRPRASHPAHHRQRQQTRRHPARAAYGTHDRSRRRGTPRRCHPGPP
jgi:Phage integrase, N-terminal SAM-like domain